jgi:hypothetical protein
MRKCRRTYGHTPGSISLCAAIRDETGEDIHLRAVFVRRGANLLRDGEAVPLPVEAAAHRPGEDAGEFFLFGILKHI